MVALHYSLIFMFGRTFVLRRVIILIQLHILVMSKIARVAALLLLRHYTLGRVHSHLLHCFLNLLLLHSVIGALQLIRGLAVADV